MSTERLTLRLIAVVFLGAWWTIAPASTFAQAQDDGVEEQASDPDEEAPPEEAATEEVDEESESTKLARPSDVTRQLKAVARVFVCQSCKGSGVTEKRVPLPAPSGGRSAPRYKTVKVECENCEGKKVAERARYEKAMTKFITSLTVVDQGDRAFDSNQDVWWDEFKSMLSKVTTEASEKVNEQLRRLVESRRDFTGECHLALCERAGSRTVNGVEARAYSVIGTQVSLVLVEPVLDSSSRLEPRFIFVGGIVTGRDGDRRDAPVLMRGGFAVAAD